MSDLPLLDKFLLSLLNNNYSNNTLSGYERDLYILRMFLYTHNLEFDSITKIDIDNYKGYLRRREYLADFVKLRKDNEEDESGIGIQYSFKKSSPRGPRRRFDIETLERPDRAITFSGKSLDSRSINRMLSSIRSYFVFLIDNDYKVPIPPDAIKMVKTIRKESQVAELNELIKIIEAPKLFEKDSRIRIRNEALLETLFATGMRVSELVGLNLQDLNMGGTNKKILDNKIYILGKGKKRRYVYLTHRAIKRLEEYLNIREDKYPSLFIPYKGKRHNQNAENTNNNSMRLSVRFVQALIKKYSKLLGILIPTTPHSLRHGFATYMAEEGANPAAIQRLLGHESLQTTTRYVHSSDRFAERSHHDFHPLQD